SPSQLLSFLLLLASLFSSLMLPLPPSSTLFPYTTLFRSNLLVSRLTSILDLTRSHLRIQATGGETQLQCWIREGAFQHWSCDQGDRKSTRLNSSHVSSSYAVFCLKKKM